jgi:Vacuolar sorting protein 9 (VPS9) domain
LPEPLRSILTIINDTVQTLHQQYNIAKKESRELLPFCKCSIEKYIYRKMHPKIMRLYIYKLKAEDAMFKQKKEALLKKSKEEILNSLGFKEYLLDPKAEGLYYAGSIQSINAVQHNTIPYKKLLCIHEAVSLMKTTVYDSNKGKKELNSMDDYLPIMIFCLIYCTLDNPSAELHLIKDYLALLRGDHESEMMMITHFTAALTFINQWKVE